MLCPHSAVGVSALHQRNLTNSRSVALATAHDGKFPAACSMAVPNLPPPPPQLAQLKSMPTRSQTCENEGELQRVAMLSHLYPASDAVNATSHLLAPHVTAGAVQAFVKRKVAERVSGKKKREMGMWIGIGALVVVLGMALARRTK